MEMFVMIVEQNFKDFSMEESENKHYCIRCKHFWEMNYYYCPICSIVLTDDVTEHLSLGARLGMRVVPPIEVYTWLSPMENKKFSAKAIVGLVADDFEVAKTIYLYCKHYLVKARISDFKEITVHSW